jgi:hypothetical protein
MATLNWSFLRPKPKPSKAATSTFVRSRLNEMYRRNDAPSDELRDDFKAYLAIKNRIRRAV